MYVLVDKFPTHFNFQSDMSAGRPDVAEPREVYGRRRGRDLPGVGAVTCSEFCVAFRGQERRSTVVLGLMEMPPASRWMQHTEHLCLRPAISLLL